MSFRVPALLSLGAVLLVGGLAVPSPASAAACSGTSGVTVIVDYDNGSTRIGCAPGDPASGYEALKDAGFTITLAQGNGAGAICQINDVPDHQCASMPPANAYWAYFHASRGGSWTYSNTGGGGYDPKPGTVEGWRFRGDGATPPGVAPPAAVATPTPRATPTVKKTPRPTRTPSPVNLGTPVPPAAPDAVATGPSTGVTTTATPSAIATATDGSTPTASPTASASVGAAEVDRASSPLTHPDHSSGGISWVWGLALVLVLGAAGAFVARRRQG